MRLLHLADIHLDTPFQGRNPELRERLRRASKDAFVRACDAAIERDVDVVLIAGDLFDNERPSFETEAFLQRQLARLGEAGVDVIYATGNHDPGRSDIQPLRQSWPAHVTVASSRDPVRVPVRRESKVVGWVTTAGHETNRETINLARSFPRPTSDLPEVAMLHTQVHGAPHGDDHHPYAPSTLTELERASFHYWALGHVHTRQRLSSAPTIWYPGNLQGRTPAETGPKGGLLVELAEPTAPEVTFLPFAPVIWTTIEVGQLRTIRTVEGVVRRVREVWRKVRDADPFDPPEGWIVRVELIGASPLWKEIEDEDNRATLADEIADALGVLHVEIWDRRLHAPLNLEDHAERHDVLGEAIRIATEVIEGRELLPDAGPGDLAATDDDPEVHAAAWVRQLLAEDPGELIARLLTHSALREEIERVASEPEVVPVEELGPTDPQAALDLGEV